MRYSYPVDRLALSSNHYTTFIVRFMFVNGLNWVRHFREILHPYTDWQGLHTEGVIEHLAELVAESEKRWCDAVAWGLGLNGLHDAGKPSCRNSILPLHHWSFASAQRCWNRQIRKSLYLSLNWLSNLNFHVKSLLFSNGWRSWFKNVGVDWLRLLTCNQYTILLDSKIVYSFNGNLKTWNAKASIGGSHHHGKRAIK